MYGFLILFVDKSEAKEKKEEPSSSFQRHRVDLLLGELAKKFPPKVIPPTQPEVKGKVFLFVISIFVSPIVSFCLLISPMS